MYPVTSSSSTTTPGTSTTMASTPGQSIGGHDDSEAAPTERRRPTGFDARYADLEPLSSPPPRHGPRHCRRWVILCCDATDQAGVRHAAADRAGRRFPGDGNAGGVRARRQRVRARPDHRARAVDPASAAAGGALAPTPHPAVSPPVGGGAARTRPALLDRGPGLRHRVPRPGASVAGPRRRPPVDRAGGPVALPAAGPDPAVVGAVPDRGSGRWPGGGLYQGAPRRYRRCVRQRPARRAAGPIAAGPRPASGTTMDLRRGARVAGAAGPQRGSADRPATSRRTDVGGAAAVAAGAGRSPGAAPAARDRAGDRPAVRLS